MKKVTHPQKLNYLAVGFLEKLGNLKPSQAEIDLMESLLSTVFVLYVFNRKRYK